LLVRRRRIAQALPAQIKPAPALRLLIVTARPQGATDVAYRTISRPLVESLRQAGVRVDIDILRPGSYQALDQHLQNVTDQKGSGFYQLIHFDTHGALLSYDQLNAAGSAGQPHMFRHYGRGQLAPYAGQRAFLFLENESGDDADPVEAAELANLLTTHQIPIVILNACQSGKQVGVSETSLGACRTFRASNKNDQILIKKSLPA